MQHIPLHVKKNNNKKQKTNVQKNLDMQICSAAVWSTFMKLLKRTQNELLCWVTYCGVFLKGRLHDNVLEGKWKTLVESVWKRNIMDMAARDVCKICTFLVHYKTTAPTSGLPCLLQCFIFFLQPWISYSNHCCLWVELKIQHCRVNEISVGPNCSLTEPFETLPAANYSIILTTFPSFFSFGCTVLIQVVFFQKAS